MIRIEMGERATETRLEMRGPLIKCMKEWSYIAARLLELMKQAGMTNEEAYKLLDDALGIAKKVNETPEDEITRIIKEAIKKGEL